MEVYVFSSEIFHLGFDAFFLWIFLCSSSILHLYDNSWKRTKRRCLTTKRERLDKRIWQSREREEKEEEGKVNAYIYIRIYVVCVYKYLWPSFYFVFPTSSSLVFSCLVAFAVAGRSGCVYREKRARRWFFLHDERRAVRAVRAAGLYVCWRDEG